MRNGVRLGVDVGSVRIGVARSDPSGMLATPVETVRRGRDDLHRLAEIAAEYEAVEVVVGLPTSLSGREGAAAGTARAFAGRIAARLAPVPVRLFDERLTTVTAQQGLRASGVRAKNQRAVVDQAAAVVLLQAALDAERATGRPPGAPVTPPRPRGGAAGGTAGDAGHESAGGPGGRDVTGGPGSGAGETSGRGPDGASGRGPAGGGVR